MFEVKMEKLMTDYEHLLPKNELGQRTHLTCELCGFEPKTKNKYRERQDHLMRTHFMHKVAETFPTFSNFNCPSSDCVFIGKDKQSLLRHYISKHGFIEECLREALAEKGIEYQPAGYERAPKKRTQHEDSTMEAAEVTEYITEGYTTDGVEGGLNDETVVFVALDDTQAQAYETSAYVDGTQVQIGDGSQVVGHIAVTDGVVGTITLLDASMAGGSSNTTTTVMTVDTSKKNPVTAADIENAFYHEQPEEEKRRKRKRKRRPTPDPNEDSRTKMLRKIVEHGSDLEGDSDDSDSDASNVDYIEIPKTERRLKKEIKNYRMLQLLVVDLERENATLRHENKALRSRTNCLLDAMIEQKKKGELTARTLQRLNQAHSSQNATLMSEAFAAAKRKPARPQLEEEVDESAAEQQEIDLTADDITHAEEEEDDDEEEMSDE